MRCARGGSVTLDPDGAPNAARPGLEIATGTSEAVPEQGQPSPAGQRPVQDGPPSQPGGQPPQAALDACTGAAQGTACQFTTPRGTVTGSCLPAGGQVACVPAGGPPGMTG